MIKKNEQVARIVINEFKDYAQSINEIKKKYDSEEYRKQIVSEAKQKGIKPENFDLTTVIIEIQKELNLEEEKLKIEREKLHTILNGFTQEMLVFIFNEATNPEFKNEVYKQIESNNNQIDYFNNLASESGGIFQDLELMSKEQLSRITSLRETEEDIELNKLVLQHLNSNVIRMVSKVMSGQSLEEEKADFCRKHNLSNEVEFQFYEKSFYNKKVLELATDDQKALNELLNIDNDELVNLSYNDMSRIKINIDEKKK